MNQTEAERDVQRRAEWGMPPKKLITKRKFIELVKDVHNASFECGEWQKGDDEDWDSVYEYWKRAEAKLNQAIDELYAALKEAKCR